MGALSSINKLVQSVVGWITLFLLMSGGYSFLLANAPRFAELNWAEVALLAIVMALVTMLALSLAAAIGGYGFRLIKPLPGAVSPAPGPNPHESINSRVKENVRKLREAVSQLDQRVSTMDQRRSAESVGLSEVRAIVEELRQASANVEPKILEISTRLESIRNVATGAEITAGELLRENETRNANVAKRFDEIHHSFVAIHYRERMVAIAERMNERSRKLHDAVEGNDGKPLTPGEWHKWENSEERWRTDLNEWCSIARFYVSDAQEKIEAPNRHIFERGNWQFSEEQFPSSGSDSHQRSNAVVRYKNFRIAEGNFEAISQQVHDVARKVAFEGYVPPHWKEGK